MRIRAEQIKKLRTERQWSQEQLAAACGVNLRTIQRLENTGKASTESVRALAAVFQVDANELIVRGTDRVATPLDAVRAGFVRGADFSGTASRFEFWWFFLFVLLVTAAAALVSPLLPQAVGLIVLVPFLAVGTRRLRDAGRSGWWHLMWLVPFGQVVVLYLLALHSQSDADASDPDPAKAA